MKVILIEEVPKLGKAGDQVDVAPGFARNFLLPRRLAVEATPQNLRALEQLKAAARQREDRLKREAETVAQQLKGVSLTISRRAGEQDHLFGSVTKMDIAEALAARGIRLDRKKIQLEEPIRALGTYTIPIRLRSDVAAEMQVQVVKEEIERSTP